jgi:hypothetical protein
MSNLPKVGDTFPTRYHGIVTVIEYVHSKHVVVVFQDGAQKVVANKELRNGIIKNNFHPEIYGVGYLGEGPFSSGCKGQKGSSKEYHVWTDMLKRCYDSSLHEKQPTYKGCSVSEGWLNFQNFAAWLTKQTGFKEGWHLDKDIICTGNKIYSPSTCTLVPQEINNLLTLRGSCRGDTPLGVTRKGRGFIASLSHGDSSKHLGVFPTAQEAFSAYKMCKEQRIKDVVSRYRDSLTPETYLALSNYEISIDD